MAMIEWPLDDDVEPEDPDSASIYDDEDELDGILDELDEPAEYELGGEG